MNLIGFFDPKHGIFYGKWGHFVQIGESWAAFSAKEGKTLKAMSSQSITLQVDSDELGRLGLMAVVRKKGC